MCIYVICQDNHIKIIGYIIVAEINGKLKLLCIVAYANFNSIRSILETADCSISVCTNRQIEFYLFVRRREPFPLLHAAKFLSIHAFALRVTVNVFPILLP